MASIFLKEKLPKLTPIIVILSIVGITFLAQPTFLLHILHETDTVKPLNIDGLIAVFIAVVARGITTTLTRTAKNAHFIQLEIASSAQAIFVTVPMLLVLNDYVIKNDKLGDFNPNTWIFDIKSVLIMIVMGFIGFSGLCLWTIGFQCADATKVTWIEYMSLSFTFLYQIFLFHEIPNQFEVIGAMFIAVTCCLSLLEEFYNYYTHKSKYFAAPDTDTDDANDTEECVYNRLSSEKKLF
eukprot:388744_1